MVEAAIPNCSGNRWWLQPAYYLAETSLCSKKGLWFWSSKALEHRLKVSRTSHMLTLKNSSIIQIYSHTIIIAGKMSKDVSIEKNLKYSQNLSGPAIRYRNWNNFSQEKPSYTFTWVKSAIANVAFDWAGWQFSVMPLCQWKIWILIKWKISQLLFAFWHTSMLAFKSPSLSSTISVWKPAAVTSGEPRLSCY